MRPRALPLVCAAIAVIERRGRYLVSRRRAGDHLGGMWEFPGGKRRAAESWRACLVRELDEGTTSLEEEMGRPVAFDDLAACLRRGFEETMGVPFVEQPLTAREQGRIEILVKEKYGTDAWNFAAQRRVIR